MSRSRYAIWKLVALGALIAGALGAAYLGFQSAGGPGSGQPFGPGVDGKGQPKKSKDGPPAPHLNGSEDKDGVGKPDDESEFHRKLKRFFSGLDEHALDDLKPIGITKVEGVGGKGLGKQVKSGGKWYPVFDLSQVGGVAEDAAAQLEKVALNKVKLAIASPNPPRGGIGQPYSYKLEAIGGTPPYHWSMQAGGEAGGFVLDATSGILSGQSAKPVTASLNVFVGDSEGGQASTAYTLVIVSDSPLAITTAELPGAVVGQPYQVVLAGEGGELPYEWSVNASAGDWVCDPMTGMITGTPTKAEEATLQVTLTDKQHTTVQKTLQLSATAGLEIITESPLPPVSPGDQYSVTFEASGGAMPYTWKLVDGSLPDGWRFSTDGTLTGVAAQEDGIYKFTLEVADAAGLTFRKPFDLALIQALIVVPSRNRVGLAWQPQHIAQSIGSPLQGVSIQRSGPDGKVEVYRGANLNNMVDHNLITGVTYEYTLTAHAVDGHAVAFSKARARILPMTLQRAEPGVTGDPYADRVRAYSPLSATAYGIAGLPYNVTGPPDGHSTLVPASAETEVLSLNAAKGIVGGTITLEFTDNIVELGPGADFTVFENVMFRGGDPAKRFMEPATVEVALVEGDWHRFPFSVNPPVNGQPDLTSPSYYAQGFAGVNATTGDDPTNPSRSGGDSFDIDALGLNGISWIRFIRIQSTGHNALRDLSGKLVQHTDELGALSGGGSSGFDLDAVSAVNY